MGAELVPEATEVLPGDSLRFVLVNDGPGSVAYGHGYQIQLYQDGEWTEADVEEPERAFVASLHSMPAGATFAQELGLRADVAPGRYRVLKDVSIESRGVTLSFEFTIGASR